MKCSVLDLYDKCIYSSISHAISNLTSPFFSYEQSWDIFNYSFIDGSSRGLISFDLDNGICSGAVRSDKSERMLWYPKYKALDFFSNSPRSVVQMAETETLEYLYDVVKGKKIPVVTAAFWIENNNIEFSDTLSLFIENGGEYINDILTCTDLANYWSERYELTELEQDVINSLYHSFKIGNKVIDLNRLAIDLNSYVGYEECKESLLEIGFIIQNEVR